MRKRIRSAGVLLTIALLLSGCGRVLSYTPPITDVNDLEGRYVGVAVAWESDYILTPRTDLKLKRYETNGDAVMALRYGQVDALALNAATVGNLQQRIGGLRVNPTPIVTEGIGAIVHAENTELLDELNAFTAEYRRTPEWAQLQDMIDHADTIKYVEPIEATGTGEVLRVAVDDANFPLTYYDISSDRYVGLEVNIIQAFANARNYQAEFSGMDYTGIQMGVVTGKYDIGVDGFVDVFRDDIEFTGLMRMSDSILDMDVLFVETDDPSQLKVIAPMDK